MGPQNGARMGTPRPLVGGTADANGDDAFGVAIKGYEHYPCLRKLDRLLAGNEDPGGRIADAAATLTWVAQSVGLIGTAQFAYDRTNFQFVGNVSLLGFGSVAFTPPVRWRLMLSELNQSSSK